MKKQASTIALRRHFLILFCFGMCLSHSSWGQHQSWLQSNYAGINAVHEQPAAIVDSRLKFDLNLGGGSFYYSNNIMGFSPIELMEDFAGSEKKNFTVEGEHFGIFGARADLISLAFPLSPKASVGLSSSFRLHATIDAMDAPLAALLQSSFNDTALHNREITENDLDLRAATWMEYGITLGQVLFDQREHFLKGAARVKLLVGSQAAHFGVEDATYSLDSDKRILVNSGSFRYGHSENLDSSWLGFNNWQDLFQKNAVLNPGFDLGLVYEFRPRIDSFRKYQNVSQWKDKRSANKYDWRIGFSLTDLGSLRFKKAEASRNFEGSSDLLDLTIYDYENIGILDDTINAFFDLATDNGLLLMPLPTAANLNVDFHLGKGFYLNADARVALNNGKKPAALLSRGSASLSPRFESRWFELGIPISVNGALQPKLGTFMRIGPLAFGTQDLAPFLWTKERGEADAYFYTKISIPFNDYKDSDDDGIPDKKDRCPFLGGPKSNKGCPDAGPLFNPNQRDITIDADQDGILNEDDNCPDLAGGNLNAGCPDSDGDGVWDDVDACPEMPGGKDNEGCPYLDVDGDELVGPMDNCPDQFGLKENAGCPPSVSQNNNENFTQEIELETSPETPNEDLTFLKPKELETPIEAPAQIEPPQIEEKIIEVGTEESVVEIVEEEKPEQGLVIEEKPEAESRDEAPFPANNPEREIWERENAEALKNTESESKETKAEESLAEKGDNPFEESSVPLPETQKQEVITEISEETSSTDLIELPAKTETVEEPEETVEDPNKSSVPKSNELPTTSSNSKSWLEIDRTQFGVQRDQKFVNYLAKQIAFKPNNTRLDQEELIQFGNLLFFLQSNKDYKAIFSFHSHRYPSGKDNQAVCRNRGEDLKRHLIAQGISEDRFEIKVMGNLEPHPDKIGDRVEVKLLGGG